MKRRDVIKTLTLLPTAGRVRPKQFLLSAPVTGNDFLSMPQNKPMPTPARQTVAWIFFIEKYWSLAS